MAARQLISLAGEQTGYEDTHKGRREKDSEKHTVCPRGIVLMLSSSSWLNGITSVTFGERVFTCSLEGCCAGVLRRDQTEANDPDGNETEFALCRSPQTSQTRPRPLSFFVSSPLNFLSFAQTFPLYLSFSTFLSGLVSCHALAGCLWTDFTACQAIYKCLHFPCIVFAAHPSCHGSAAVKYEIKIDLGLNIARLMNDFSVLLKKSLFCFILSQCFFMSYSPDQIYRQHQCWIQYWNAKHLSLIKCRVKSSIQSNIAIIWCK